MSSLLRKENDKLSAAGMGQFGERGPIENNVNDEFLDADQKITDLGLPGEKLRDLTVDKLLAGVIRVTTSIQSTGFTPGVTGWYIDGEGNATFNNIILIGGELSYGKTSFTDDTHSGYWISPDGIYMGDIGDTTYLKYDIALQTLTVLGTIQSGPAPGKRVVMSAANNDFEAYDAADELIFKLGGDGNATVLSIYQPSAASSNAIYAQNNSIYPTFDVLKGGTGGSAYSAQSADAAGVAVNGPLINLLQHADTAAARFESDSVQGGSGGVVEAIATYGATAPSVLGRAAMGNHSSIGVYGTVEDDNSLAWALYGENNTVVDGNFYRITGLSNGGATVRVTQWVGDADPDGTLNGAEGDLLQRTDVAGLYLCLGGTSWTNLGGAIPPTLAFTDLTDVPSSYAGANSYSVAVNAGATGLEFITPRAEAGTNNDIEVLENVHLYAVTNDGSDTGTVRFYELAANGTNYVALAAPDVLAGDYTYTLPTVDGTQGMVLATDGGGAMDWVWAAKNFSFNPTVTPGSPDTCTVDWNDGQVACIDAAGDIDIDLDNPENATKYIIKVLNTTGAAYTITWGTGGGVGLIWRGGTGPTPTADFVWDIYTLIYIDDGTFQNYYADVVYNFF